MLFCCMAYFSPEDEADMLLQNIDWLSANYTAVYPRRSLIVKSEQALACSVKGRVKYVQWWNYNRGNPVNYFSIYLLSSVFFQKNGLWIYNFLWTCSCISHSEGRAIDFGCLRMMLTEEKLFLSLSRRESETVIERIFKLLIRWWSVNVTQNI
jgi:hypothetical protein